MEDISYPMGWKNRCTCFLFNDDDMVGCCIYCSRIAFFLIDISNTCFRKSVGIAETCWLTNAKKMSLFESWGNCLGKPIGPQEPVVLFIILANGIMRLETRRFTRFEFF